MQRDLKVGLSLGVLVLGVVGALLFRREQVSESPKTPLKTARKIDERIADRPRTPYMVGDIEFDQDNAPVGNGGEERLADSDRPAHTVPPNWLDDAEDPFQVTQTPNRKHDHSVDSQLADSTAIPVAPRAVTARRPTETEHAAALQTHVIKSGESLSTIAEHYLGSQGRFQELYDANRDVLTDPNRLPLGATIVIPPNSAKVTSKSHALAQAPATSRGLPGHPEKARGTITDVSSIEPIAPPSEEPFADLDLEQTGPTKPAEQDKRAEQAAGVTPMVPTQTRETRKLFSASRLPFSNNRTQPVNRNRKPLDPEGEDFAAPAVTPVKGVAPAVPGEPRMYQVRKGDSLEKISQKAYGNGKRAADIFAANRALLASPDAVREGQELVLPD